jgi:hypothetical protein
MYYIDMFTEIPLDEKGIAWLKEVEEYFHHSVVIASGIKNKKIKAFQSTHEEHAGLFIQYSQLIYIGTESDEFVLKVLERFKDRPYFFIFTKGKRTEQFHFIPKEYHFYPRYKFLEWTDINPPPSFDNNIYDLSKINEKDFEIINNNSESKILRYHGLHYFDYSEFNDAGGGFQIKHKGEIVSLCTVFCHSDGHVEVQVDTSPEHQRQNLAASCSYAFIKNCLVNKITPHWDAASYISRNLALKIGFHEFEEYFMIYRGKLSLT